MSNAEVIEQLYHDMYSAMINKDSKKLAEILDDRFVLVHMTGMRQAKNEYIKAIADGVLNYYSESAESISINIQGGFAKLTGKSRVNAEVFPPRGRRAGATGGGRHTWRLQLDIDLVMNGDNWLITHAEASTY